MLVQQVHTLSVHCKLTAKDVSVVELLVPTESLCKVPAPVVSRNSVKVSLTLAGSASFQHDSILQMHTAPLPTIRGLALPPWFLTI